MNEGGAAVANEMLWMEWYETNGSMTTIPETPPSGFRVERESLSESLQRIRIWVPRSLTADADSMNNTCPKCHQPVQVWEDRSDGVTVNYACDNQECSAGKGPWDTERPEEGEAK